MIILIRDTNSAETCQIMNHAISQIDTLLSKYSLVAVVMNLKAYKEIWVMIQLLINLFLKWLLGKLIDKYTFWHPGIFQIFSDTHRMIDLLFTRVKRCGFTRLHVDILKWTSKNIWNIPLASVHGSHPQMTLNLLSPHTTSRLMPLWGMFKIALGRPLRHS